jgi:hypothetical protein
LRAVVLVLITAFLLSVCCAAEFRSEGNVPSGLEGIWDANRYISAGEIKPGMEAYCLTVYKGSAVEKFGLEVLSVVKDFMPGRDAILVRGTDERFIHTGPVAGCSGSPVYIEGRLAGALAFGWTFSKDPLYGVTPIADMLRVGTGGPDFAQVATPGRQMTEGGPGFNFDLSKPIDLKDVEKKISAGFSSARRDFSGMTMLPSPLVVSGMTDSVRADLAQVFEPLGFEVVNGGGGSTTPAAGGSSDVCETAFVPGGCLVVPLMAGDITIEAVGTVTEVRGNDVYGFGHSLLGYGGVDLPMATGQIHTVVSSVMRSFKVGTSTKIAGALTTDESTAVRGKIGAQARMIPLKVKITRYNDPNLAGRVYNCQIVDNRTLTPLVLRAGVSGLVQMRGALPPDNTLYYKGNIELDNGQTISFENISTGQELAEVIRDGVSPAALLMNNPYSKVKIKSFDFDIRVSEKNVLAGIWSVELSQSKVKPGENLEVDVVLERFLAQKQKYTFDFVVPKDTPAGTYQLIVCGGYDYEEFLKMALPFRFVPENLDTLVGAINDVLAIDRDELHCMLILPGGGVALENAELPGLPATKALVLGDATRAAKMQVYPGWLEKKVRTGFVLVDQQVMNVTVE